MYRLAPSRCARRPKHPAKRSRNVPSRSSTARADDTDKFTGHKSKKSQHKVQDLWTFDSVHCTTVRGRVLERPISAHTNPAWVDRCIISFIWAGQRESVQRPLPRNRSRGSEPSVSRFAAILVLTLAAACSGSHLGPTAGSCPVTATIYDRPPSDPNPLHPELGPGPWYINADRTIWATVGSEGFRQGDNKVMWVRPAGAQLIVTGQRLDASAAPLSAQIPCCYPSTFQASGLTFPTPGCWQVTAKAGTKELQFMALVREGP